MQLTLQTKLLPTEEQSRLLAATQQRYSQLCNYLSILVHQTHITHPMAMHRQFYKDLRFMFADLPCQMVVRAFAKVSGAYRARIANAKRRKKSTNFTKPCVFRTNTTIDYDQRIYSVMSFTKSIQTSSRCTTIKFSIATITGRIHIDAMIPSTMLTKLGSRWKQATLNYRKSSKEWYLNLACDIDETPPKPYTKYLGVDLGITNIASTSDGTLYSGTSVDAKRVNHYIQVRQLQKRGTRSSKRKLIKINRRMSNYIRTLNHTVSKQLVEQAQRTGSAIVLEQLKYIFDTLKARRAQRQRMFGWSFAQLRDFIVYKAKWLGVQVIVVDPKYTSQTCPECGHIARNNRKGERFRCRRCDYESHADTNGALNIGMLGMFSDHCQELGMASPSYHK